jgi:dTDP-glucose 4,6-dehydratase
MSSKSKDAASARHSLIDGSLKTIFVTGGAGFIGSAFLNLYVPRFPHLKFVNVDKLTYAGNLMNLEQVSAEPNYRFEKVDLADGESVRRLFHQYSPEAVIHFAAETHVDRSIADPKATFEANVVGTFNLLEACRSCWTDLQGKVFHHVSTDEVFGTLGDEGAFCEDTRYDPSSPYSASKAASDHLVRAWYRTFGLPVTLSNCSNNYGPRQFPEKLIPLMILNAAQQNRMPVYGSGSNVRDWLWVEDHCEAIWEIATRGALGETYNVGGNCERTNLEVVTQICDLVGQELGKPEGELRGLIQFVADRPGHDFRYAIDSSKIRRELGWAPNESFETGIERTVQWYLQNPGWVEQVRSGDYLHWIDSNYGSRNLISPL